MTAAERDQGVTEPGDCWICNPPDPGPCPEHGEACGGLRGCKACVRENFADWLAFIGSRRVCDASGMREERAACPGCAACTTAETPCPAFALPDEPWIPAASREAPCVFCGEEQAKHRTMPPTPWEAPRPEDITAIAICALDDSPAAPIVILRDPR